MNNNNEAPLHETLQGFGTVFITNFEIPKKPCTKIDIPQGFGYGGRFFTLYLKGRLHKRVWVR